jgi:hypothetical protein
VANPHSAQASREGLIAARRLTADSRGFCVSS